MKTLRIALLITFLGSAFAGGLPQHNVMSYVLERDDAKSSILHVITPGGAQYYKIHHADSDIEFNYVEPGAVTQFVVSYDSTTGSPHFWILIENSFLKSVSSSGVVMDYSSQGKFTRIAAGPNGSVIGVSGQNRFDVKHITAGGSSQTFTYPTQVDNVTWGGSANGFTVIAEMQGQSKMRQLFFQPLNGPESQRGSFDLTAIKSTYGGLRVKSIIADVALIHSKYTSPSNYGHNTVGDRYYLAVFDRLGTRTYQLPSNFDNNVVQLLDVESDSDGHRAFLRVGKDFTELKLTLNDPNPIQERIAVGVLTYDQIIENPGKTGQLPFTAIWRKSLGLPAQAGPMAEAAPVVSAGPSEEERLEKEHQEKLARVRQAVRDEVKRLADKLRYMGYREATLSSRDFVRALEQAGGDAFWERSLFKDIDTRELLFSPVTMDEMVEVLASKLPENIVCQIPLVKP